MLRRSWRTVLRRRWGGLPLPGGGRAPAGAALPSAGWVKAGRARARRRESWALLAALAAGGGLFAGGLWARSLAPAGRLALRAGDELPEEGYVVPMGENGEEWGALDAEHERRWWVGRTEFDVPHRIIFTYSDNMLETRSPPFLHRNVMHTVAAYRSFWREPEAPVHFLDNAACAEVIERVDAMLGFGPEDGVLRGPLHRKRLVDYFWEEPRGSYKGDLCRTAALYDWGGYYFDVDIKVIDPVGVSKGTGLISSLEYGEAHMEVIQRNWLQRLTGQKPMERLHTPSVFQAFIAAAPQHPVLRESLRLMYKTYQGTYDYEHEYHGCKETGCLFGTKIFKDSLDPYVLANQPYIDWDHQLVKMLKESKLSDFDEKEFANVPRQEGLGDCDFFVLDPQGHGDHRAKFYSRVPGASFVCCPPEDSPDFPWAAEDCKRILEDAKKDRLKEELAGLRDRWALAKKADVGQGPSEPDGEEELLPTQMGTQRIDNIKVE